MRFLADVAEGLASLRSHSQRALSTVLGVAWGTFAVVGLGAFSTGLEENMAERSAGMGEGIAVTWPSRTTRPWRGIPEGRFLRLTADEVRDLRDQVPEIAEISPEYTRYERMQRGPYAFRPQVTGVDPDYGPMRTMIPAPGGRFINPVDVAQARRVVFLGDRVARQLFGRQQAVGRSLLLGDAPFTVVGVLATKEQDSDYGARDEARVFIPASTFEQLYGVRFVTNFVMRASHPDRLPRAIDGVYEALGRRLGFDPADRLALLLWDTTEDDRIRAQAFVAMDILMLLAGSFTVLVGAIGVGNLMFLVVRRRTGELGLKMALGARPRWVLRQILCESLVLIAAGGFLGFFAAAGVAGIAGASPLAENLGQPRIAPALGVGVWLLLAVVGLVAGWFPARRAAGLDPAAALTEAR